MEENNKNNRSFFGLLLWFLVFAAICILTGFIGFGWQQVQEELNQLQTSSEKNRQDVLTNNLNASKTSDKLTELGFRVDAVTDSQRERWLLSEAESFADLAWQRLILTRDVQGAMLLLKAADRAVSEVTSSASLIIRPVIAENILALKSANAIDSEALYSRLHALHKQIDQLTQLKKNAVKIELLVAEERYEALDWSDSVARGWQNTLNKLSSFIVIQHHDEVIKPLLSNKEYQLVKQNIQLLIEQSQLSLLQGKGLSYTESLQQAKQWVAQYFSTNTIENQLVSDELKALIAIDIRPALPDIRAVVDLIRQYKQDENTMALPQPQE